MNLTGQEQIERTAMDTTNQAQIWSADMHITTQAQMENIDTNGATEDLFTVPAWLAKAITPASLCNGLRQRVPEFASGQLTIVDCEVKRLRLHKGQDGWSGICLLTIADSPAAEPQTVALRATLLPPNLPEPAESAAESPFGSEAWRCYLPDLRLELFTQRPETKLAMLPELTDPEAARDLLEASIRSGGNPAYSDFRIESCQPQVMRYKPGSRCTVLYHLDYAPGQAAEHTWPDIVVAKTYRGDKGETAYKGMQALWQSPLRSSQTVAIAEPLAYMPDLHVLVQGPIRQEMTLKELVRDTLQRATEQSAPEQMDELSHYLRKTAAGLAELHQCGARTGEIVTWEDELADTYQGRAGVATVLPHLANLGENLLDQLQALAINHPTDPLAPAHRSFRPAQVLLAHGEIGFIDFDGFCQAEPAMDLALFMTTIKNIALNKPSKGKKEGQVAGMTDPEQRLARLMQAEALNQLFLTEYEKHASVSRPRIVLWETLQLLSLVLGSWKKLKLDRLENCRFMLERHLMCNGMDVAEFAASRG